MKHLKKRKVLEVPDGAKAEYLTRTFDETGVEVLKKAIEQDIHKFSHIPCMTDESFGGNVSGVAMEFKVLGMENITKIKTRYYKRTSKTSPAVLRLSVSVSEERGSKGDYNGIHKISAEEPAGNFTDCGQFVGQSQQENAVVADSVCRRCG